MAFGAKGKFEKGDFNIDDALGAQQSTEVETPKQEVAEQPKEVVETKEELKQPIAEQPKPEYSEIVDTKKEVVETKEEPKTQEQVKDEITDETILTFLNKKNNTTFKSLDEYQASLVQEKEVVKEVDPYADLLDDADREYFEFKKQTGGSYQDFLQTKKNWDEVSDEDLARDRVRQETGLELTNAQADEYIASELGIDLEDLEGVDKIKFQAYASKHRKALKEEQKKYSTAKKLEQPKSKEPQEEIVTLEDGRQFPKAEYERLVNERNQFLANTKKAVDSITDFSFKLTVSDNGENRDIDINYAVTPEDKHSMLSASEQGLNNFVDTEFTNKDGEFMHREFHEALFFAKQSNREKVFKAIAEKARAEAIEEMLNQGNNVNFERRKLDTSKESNKGYGDFLGKKSAGYGVIGSI